MFEHVFRGGASSKAWAFGIRADRKGLLNSAAIVIEAMVLVVAGALFAAWLITSSSFWLKERTDLSGGCPSLGRGGDPCVLRPAQGDRADRSAGVETDCASFGKGGRVCFRGH